MKKLAVCSIIMLLLLFLSPCINATIHIEKQSNESGRIHGNVYESSFFESPPVVGAKLVLETEGITKTTYTGLLGGFKFKNLPIGLTYTITASHPKYDTKVYTYTLSPDKPDLEVAMNLYRKDDSITRDINQDESCGGTIYGYTLESHDTWGAYPVPLALVDAGIKQTISGPIMGYYRITGLPFDQEITITASKKGYDSDTLKHTFTELRPTYYYCFDLQEDEDDLTKEKNVEEPKCLGSIYGNAGTSHGWGFTAVFFAKITAGGRTTISLPFTGQYRINNLPLGTYTITGSKIGYDTFTDTVTLTKDRPDKQVFIHMEPNDKSVNKAKTLETSKTTVNEPKKLGSIWGNTGEQDIWGFSPVGLVKVEAGGKTTTSSPILGYYWIRNLPLGTYTVTGTKKGYETRTETVKLTEERPDQQCFIHMEPNDENVKEKTNKEKIVEKDDSAIFGRVSGMVHTGGFPPYTYISGAKIVLEGDFIKRTTYSGFLGVYRFNFVEIGKLYTLTASHPKYETETKTFTISANNPHIFINFPMYIKENIKTKNEKPAN